MIDRKSGTQDLVSSQYKLDDKDRLIVDNIIQHPEARAEELAQILGYPLPTVHRRLLQLLRNEVLERGTTVRNWTAVGYPLRYWIDIRANHRALQDGKGGPPRNRQIDSLKKLAQYIMRDVGRDYAARRELIVQDVTILLGSPADLSVYIRASNHHAVLDFLSHGLGVLGGVESTQTFHEVWSSAEGNLDQ